ncbi:MAG: phosphate ABC transporter substrate-binding protein [Spirochaetales bacterium]|nr:phosphate ABC transporter substrate-binding protein [Spirochaetales bacterium]
MKKILTIGLVVLAVASCNKSEKKSDVISGNYNFGGSTTVEPIMNAAAEELKEKFKDINISYDSTGSTTGFTGVASGIYSLGGMSRELAVSEESSGLKVTPIALDGVAVIVNKASVGIDDLTMSDVGKIYAGEIKNWKELGGVDAEIVVYNRDEASGTRDCFGITVKYVGKKFRNDCPIVTSNGDMVSKVATTPNSIGYCGFGYIEKDQRVKAVKIGGVEPLEENVVNGKYSISRNLNIVYKEIKEGSFEKIFLDFLLSDIGQTIAREEGFIPLKK